MSTANAADAESTPTRAAGNTAYADAEARRRSVLVAVMNNADDLRRAASDGWYRIPQRRAPKRIAADYLAFYQTGKFAPAPEAQSVTYYAPTRRYRLLTRAELMPDAADHARANDYYFRIDIGPLQRLAQPIPSATLRRLTFIHTTLDRLLSASDVRDLFPKSDPFETLWQALREHRLRPLKNRIVDEWPMDISLRARGGHLGIRCIDEDDSLRERSVATPAFESQSERWQVLAFPPSQIERDLNDCLRQIGAALIELGGSSLDVRS